MPNFAVCLLFTHVIVSERFCRTSLPQNGQNGPQPKAGALVTPWPGDWAPLAVNAIFGIRFSPFAPGITVGSATASPFGPRNAGSIFVAYSDSFSAPAVSPPY